MAFTQNYLQALIKKLSIACILSFSTISAFAGVIPADQSSEKEKPKAVFPSIVYQSTAGVKPSTVFPSIVYQSTGGAKPSAVFPSIVYQQMGGLIRPSAVFPSIV